MKIIVVLISLLGLMFTVRCEEDHEHHHGPYGGTYEGPGGYGHGYYHGDGDWHHD